MAAQALADLVSERDLDRGSLYPPLAAIQNCSTKIAVRIADYAYKTGITMLQLNLIFFYF